MFSVKFWEKADWTLVLPFIIFSCAFILHYHLVINFFEEVYHNHPDQIKDEIINIEKEIFFVNLTGNGLLLILTIIGSIISLNIGFIFFDFKFKFKELCYVVIKSSVVLVSIYLLLPIILIFQTNIYSFEDLYKIETNLSMAVFLSEFAPAWLRNQLEFISISQLFYVIVLVLGIKQIMDWNSKKATINVLQIYGTGFLIWNLFVLIMDVNFHQ
jgi:hypothetical protein